MVMAVNILRASLDIRDVSYACVLASLLFPFFLCFLDKAVSLLLLLLLLLVRASLTPSLTLLFFTFLDDACTRHRRMEG
ncbi:MAG: hypothetical protein BYD32DRAFT_413615 [Podila humilis]|nr:MAG: hypothetical protein BYD32DRAFT_413615 [Podila humilis]